MRKFRDTILLPWSGLIVAIIIWQLIYQFELINPETFPGPFVVLKETMENLTILRLVQHIGISFMRIAIGFLIGAILGIVLGILSGWYAKFGNIVSSPINMLRTIPPLAWIPIAVIWLGLGEPSKILIIFLGAFFPVFTNTLKGMLCIDPNLLRAGQSFGLKGAKLLLRIAIPATLPDIATGVMVGWSYSFSLVVAAEIIAASSGLGYMIMHARELNQIAVIFFGVFLIGFLNLVSYLLINSIIFKKLLRWHHSE